MKLEETAITADIDPYFQRMMERLQRGLTKPESTSTSASEVAVLARVTDPAAWGANARVRKGAVIGLARGEGWIVTGRVPLNRVEDIRADPAVLSLKPARQLTTVLQDTVRDVQARADLLPPGAQGNQGRGAIVGIVDFGCDFAHQNFRNPDGSSRILAIWDQNGNPRPDSPLRYGRLYLKPEIDAALQAGDPYAALGYAPEPDSAAQRGTHGTHVMDIAAGNGRGSQLPGVAPNADIIFVDVASTDVPWDGPQVVGRNFGDSVQLVEAVRFIFDTAGARPCVVNLSLGTNGGDHTGSSLVEQGLDAMVAESPNRAIVIAASNSYDDGIHAAGTVPAGGTADVLWDVPQNDLTHNELEVWYSGNDAFSAEIITPDGNSVGTIGLGQNGTVRDGSGTTLLFASHRARDPNNQDNCVNIYLAPGVPWGRWIVRLRGLSVSDGRYHAWIERDNPYYHSRFAPPHDNSHTLGSISCGHLTLVVGSYDAHDPSVPLSYFSSAGPTRDGRQKPELSAPGDQVLAAHSRTGTQLTAKSGTSMAAPAVAGAAALLLAEAAARGVSLTAVEIRDILRTTARTDMLQGQPWHDRYGFGRLDAEAAIRAVMALAQPTAAPAAPASAPALV